MSESSVKEIKDTILRFAEDKNINISKIILFGSEAAGNAKKDSDIDLMLISKDFTDQTYTVRLNKLLGLNRKLVKLTNRAFDILYYSDIEWEVSSSPMIAEAKTSGKVVYS